MYSRNARADDEHVGMDGNAPRFERPVQRDTPDRRSHEVFRLGRGGFFIGVDAGGVFTDVDHLKMVRVDAAPLRRLPKRRLVQAR